MILKPTADKVGNLPVLPTISFTTPTVTPLFMAVHGLLHLLITISYSAPSFVWFTCLLVKPHVHRYRILGCREISKTPSFILFGTTCMVSGNSKTIFIQSPHFTTQPFWYSNVTSMAILRRSLLLKGPPGSLLGEYWSILLYGPVDNAQT